MMSVISYLDSLLRCPACGSIYSPNLYVCPGCGLRISHRKRREQGNRVKAGRVVKALGESKVTAGGIHQAVYRKVAWKNKYLSLREVFVDRVLKTLEAAGCITQDGLGFKVLRRPSVDEVCFWLWGDKSQSKKRSNKNLERKQVRYVNAVKDGKEWVLKKEVKVGDVVKPFLLINSDEAVEAAGELAKQNPGVPYNCMLTNGFRATLERTDDLLRAVPNVGILACSESVWLKRLRASLVDLFEILVMPVGGVKLWTRTAYRMVHVWLSDGCSLGLICERLYSLGIKISVQGLLKWRWREIKGPPPVFVW
ncbi:MAG: hypothetical protein KKB59_19535 [Spirochaetes bacterium]|nr:hypothetical protein [Spirochaetota bacterium]